MINANELRIGNKLQKENGKMYTVSRLDGTKDILVEEERGLFTLNYNLYGIPITPEILEKCGFEKESYEMSGCEVWNFPNTFWRVARSYRDENEYKLWGKLVSPPTWNLRTFSYLHELQNIIFALTGEELNYTP